MGGPVVASVRGGTRPSESGGEVVPPRTRDLRRAGAVCTRSSRPRLGSRRAAEAIAGRVGRVASVPDRLVEPPDVGGPPIEVPVVGAAGDAHGVEIADLDVPSTTPRPHASVGDRVESYPCLAAPDGLSGLDPSRASPRGGAARRRGERGR